MEQDILVRNVSFFEKMFSLSNEMRSDVSNSVLHKQNTFTWVFLNIRNYH